MPVLSLLLFTYIFGGAIAGSPGAYLQYFVPGVLTMTVLFMTLYTGAAISADISKGIYDRFRTLPFWQPASIVGNLVADSIRYIVAIIATIVLAYVLGFRADGGLMGILWASILLIAFAFSVSWIFALIGVVAKRPETVASTSAIALYPLMFTSDIFVDPEGMPKWLQVIVTLNPISHITDATRGLIHGSATGEQITIATLLCIGIALLFTTTTMYFYRHRIT